MDGVPRVPEQWRPDGSAALRFSVLGPVRAWRGTDSLPTGSPQQRALLAALLLREGRTATAARADRRAVGRRARLRRRWPRYVRTPPGCGRCWTPDVLVSESGGYAIRSRQRRRARPRRRPRSWRRDAEKARSAGDLCHARELLNRALNLWDGEPLASVPGPYAETQRARLEEWRLQLLESRLDMDLEQGCHAEAVSELTALTAAHPLRERLRELLMLALYRSGRQAEALAVVRGHAAPARRRAGRRPAARPEGTPAAHPPGGPEPGGTVRSGAEPAAGPVRPAQLPATVSDFTGRVSFVTELSEVLPRPPPTARAGSWRCRRWPASAAWARRRSPCTWRTRPAGRSPTGSCTWTCRARAPGRPSRRRCSAPSCGPWARRTRRSRTPWRSGRRSTARCWTADGCWCCWTTPGTPPRSARCCPARRAAPRSSPPGCGWWTWSGAHLVDLDVMSPEEALQLFTKIVGAERVASEREAGAGRGGRLRIPAARDPDRRLPPGGPPYVDGVGPRGEARGRAAPPGRAPGGRPGGQGDLRARLRPAGAGPGPRVPAAGPRGRPGHLAGGSRGGAGPAASRPPRTCSSPSSTPHCWNRPRPAATATTTWSGSTRVRARSGTSSRRSEREAAMSRLLDFYLATTARGLRDRAAGGSAGGSPGADGVLRAAVQRGRRRPRLAVHRGGCAAGLCASRPPARTGFGGRSICCGRPRT